MKWNKSLLLGLLVLLSVNGFAQQFHYKATLKSVSKTGFYRIRISPEIIAYANEGLQDLRLFDNRRREIPYYLQQEAAAQRLQFRNFPFEVQQQGSNSVITVKNEVKQTLNKLVFTVSNARAERSVRISGSDDKAEWYVVRDSFHFQTVGDNSAIQQSRSLDFPATNYSFYKIEIAGKPGELPFRIQRIGTDTSELSAPGYQQIRQFQYQRKDSGRLTIIRCVMKPANHPDQLRLEITTPEKYRRDVVVRLPASHQMDATLSSAQSGVIDCSALTGSAKTSVIDLVIDNKNDEPLTIKNVSAFQLGVSITANLEAGKGYALYFGDSLLKHPEYDLVYFKEQVIPEKEILEPGRVAAVNIQRPQVQNNAQDKLITWTGLALAGGILGFLTWSMARKMKRDEVA